jgi:hypothetical protein
MEGEGGKVGLGNVCKQKEAGDICSTLKESVSVNVAFQREGTVYANMEVPA